MVSISYLNNALKAFVEASFVLLFISEIYPNFDFGKTL